ncbi:MAG: NAD(+)/NADH kinase [Negativicutes bacterium]|jgi:NAD+ kinase|nr:NAD(+)/NADH kinase [Negativicutes bacterium]MBP8628983.1 NAD(+)/NADH kinase [Negativicutes bacterium]MBP9536921.1 NAD(+)/NADH kinase [Negativicutes bacterium]MBP9949164.1 NAD(+)/NADH kinase [Negativicutes bacterium]
MLLRIGIFPNMAKKEIENILEKMINFLQTQNVEVFLPEKVRVIGKFNKFIVDNNFLYSNIDIALTLGGDGTLLSTGRKFASKGVPLCGINLGRVGFLAEIETDEIIDKLTKIINNNYFIEKRLMLEGVVYRNGEKIFSAEAINDIVVTKSGLSRMIKLKLLIDDILTAEYQADGIIFATSTGSTAYSLSAGGPIINPSLKVMLITPICPHSVNARPLIIDENEEIKLKVSARHNDIGLTVDGQIVYPLLPGDLITIKKSLLTADFIRFTDKNYYKTIKKKLLRSE